MVLRSKDFSDGLMVDLVEGGQVVFRDFVLCQHFYRVPTAVSGIGF